MQKNILYYKFVPVENPDELRKWQTLLAAERGLRGRILVSRHGINGTLGGDKEALEDYIEHMEQSVNGVLFEEKRMPDLSAITYKWSDGGWHDFPRLSVKYRDEIVSFNASEELEVNENGVKNGGTHLTPDELHALVEERGDEVIFYDGRNAYEAYVGRFKNAIIPNVKTTRDFKQDIESGEISRFKDRPIVTYCTGGIRCEILSTLMIQRGYKEVYQIDGGIVKYGEAYPDNGLWEGKLYVFDKRMVEQFSNTAEDIADCVSCESKTSEFANCDNKQCNQLIIMCASCQSTAKYCPVCKSEELALRARVSKVA